MNQASLKVEWWPLARIKPYERNARKIPAAAVDKVAQSIKEFGWRQAIVVDRKGVVVAGHVRLRAAHKLKLAKAPVHQATDLTPKQIRLYRLADNRTHDETTWDAELLALELGELAGLGADMTLTGFDPSELAAAADQADEGPAPQLDRAAELLKKWKVKTGQLWLMGGHRLYCGDATNADHVAALLAKVTKPVLCVTDPPYGVEYDALWRERYDKFKRHAVAPVTNDDRVDWTPAFALSPAAVIYVWHSGIYAADVAGALAKAGFKVRSQIIWVKQHFVMSRGAYHWKHESCWYAVKEGHRAEWQGDRTQTTVWDIANLNPMGGNKAEAATSHSTQKPVECMARPIRNHTVKGDAVYDQFLGSGTTMVACEQLGRRCYGLELEAKYCAVILERMEAMGLKPALAGRK